MLGNVTAVQMQPLSWTSARQIRRGEVWGKPALARAQPRTTSKRKASAARTSTHMAPLKGPGEAQQHDGKPRTGGRARSTAR